MLSPRLTTCWASAALTSIRWSASSTPAWRMTTTTITRMVGQSQGREWGLARRCTRMGLERSGQVGGEPKEQRVSAVACMPGAAAICAVAPAGKGSRVAKASGKGRSDRREGIGCLARCLYIAAASAQGARHTSPACPALPPLAQLSWHTSLSWLVPASTAPQHSPPHGCVAPLWTASPALHSSNPRRFYLASLCGGRAGVHGPLSSLTSNCACVNT